MRDLDSELADLIADARTRIEAMSSEDRAAMYRARQESWVRGEMAIGTDADEARYRQALRKDTD